MNRIQQKAWDLLLPDEQTALSLQFGMNKSSWQSGEIMGKSHYKYLEIKYRGEKFMKMFTEYLKLYESIIPSYISGNEIVIKYLSKCIEQRAKPKEVLDELLITNPKLKKKALNTLIINQIHDWRKSDDAHNLSVLNIVMEFDRWNNFRILPKVIQEPSAFKRRVKNSYKKHLRNLTNIHPIALGAIKKRYKTNRAPHNYLPLLCSGQMEIIKVKDTIAARRDFYSIGFYIFKTYEQADNYIKEVYRYKYLETRICRDGLEFWPKYRELIKLAVNYHEVQQITPNRRFLDIAISKLKFI